MVFDKMGEGVGGVAPEGSFDKKTWPKKYFKSIYVNPLLPNRVKTGYLDSRGLGHSTQQYNLQVC